MLAHPSLNSDDLQLSKTCVPPESNKKTKFVLIDETKLEEFLKLETILRQERNKLANECTWFIQEQQTSARFPLPAMRIAIYNTCENELRKIVIEI